MTTKLKSALKKVACGLICCISAIGANIPPAWAHDDDNEWAIRGLYAISTPSVLNEGAVGAITFKKNGEVAGGKITLATSGVLQRLLQCSLPQLL